MRVLRGVIILAAAVLVAGCSSDASNSSGPSVSVMTITAQQSVTAAAANNVATSGLKSPTSFTADASVPAGIQQDGLPIPTPVGQVGVSADVYVAAFLDSSDQGHAAGVSTKTGKVLWTTDALGPKLNQTTGQRFGCHKLDDEIVSCAGKFVDVSSGEVATPSSSVIASIPQGFIVNTDNGAVNGIALVKKDDGSQIWNIAGARFGRVLDDGNILAAVFETGKVTKTLTLDTATGKVLQELGGQSFPSGGVWLSTTEGDLTANTPGATDRVDPSTGGEQWSADGLAVSGNWLMDNINSTWTFGSETPAPVVVSVQVNGQAASADAFHALDPQSGQQLWSCDQSTCGGTKIFGFTPDRLVTGSMLLDRNSGTSLAEFGGTYGRPMLLMESYLVARDDQANQTEVLSLADGTVLWFQREDGSVIGAGSCFVIIDQLTQTRVCPQ